MKPKFGKSVNEYLEEKGKERLDDERRIKNNKYTIYCMVLMFLMGYSFLNLNISEKDIGWAVLSFLSVYLLGYLISKIENLK